MPIYEYRCENAHTFEVMQRMADDPISSCEVCGATVQRVFHPVAVHFKGSGFYNTDYGTRKRAREKSEHAASSSSSSSEHSSSSSDSSSSTSDSKSSQSKSADGKAATSSPSKAAAKD
jgi:putative FmdB family regulatory protein